MAEDENDERFPQYPERGWETAPLRTEAHQRLILMSLEALKDLEAKSRPSLGEASALGKDGSAFDAIQRAMMLFDATAGWAAAHTVGLGFADLRFLPLLPPTVRDGVEFKATKAAVDTHQHEANGSRPIFGYTPSPDEARKAARNLLEALSTSRTMGGVLRPLYDALVALDFGETLPILRPAPGAQKREFREQQLQLESIGLVAYRQKTDGGKAQALEDVGAAYGVSSHTLRTWEYRLRKSELIGPLAVETTIIRAQNAASWVVASRRGRSIEPDRVLASEGQYGANALRNAADRYQAILREEG